MSTNTDLIKLYSDSIPFVEAHPDFSIDLLPDWVRLNIDSARCYGGSLKGVILPDGRKYHLDNKLNDMTGRDWTFFINSVFTTNYPSNGPESYAHNIRKIHPTPKPPQLMRDLINFFTKKGEIVLDAFMGVGGTLLGAALASRLAIGIDLEQKYIAAYKKAADVLGLQKFPTIKGDAAKVLEPGGQLSKLLAGEKVGLFLIDPPYANMMGRTKTGADISVYGATSTPFTSRKEDLGNMDLETHLAALTAIVKKAMAFLKTEGYVVVFSKDIQPKGKELNLLHAEVIKALNSIVELNYKGMKIWADASAKFYPYGYPFSFVANQIHQYILVFRKEKRRILSKGLKRRV